MGTNRVFTPEFRLQIVKRIQKGETVRALSQELKIRRTLFTPENDSRSCRVPNYAELVPTDNISLRVS